MLYPIVMADILDSSKKEPKEVMLQFKKIVAAINKKWKRNIVSPLTITLGDEFQGVMDSIENSFHVIFDIEEIIIKEQCDFKLRYVINIGKIDTKINHQVAYEMLGPGLTEARNELNLMKRDDRRFLFKSGKDKELDYIVNNAFLVYQNIVDSWKEKDRKTVAAFLEYKDYKRVAEVIDTDTSSAWRRKKSLSITELNAMKEVLIYLSK